MKRPSYTCSILFFLFLAYQTSWSQKKVSELTIAYDYAIRSRLDDSKLKNGTINAVYIIYLKANLSSSEIMNPLFSSRTIYDEKTGSAIVLKEVSGQKLLIRMTAENWKEKNDRYQDIQFTDTAETKIIAGYKCTKARAQTRDGFTISVYYTKDLIPDNREYDPTFKNLSGLPLEYELTKGDYIIKYSLSSINLSPVPASRFDIPKSGYREMSYEESKKLGVGSW
jgi:GLPGLI family protein